MATNFFIKSYYMFLIIDFAYKNMQKKSFGQLITKIRQNVAINFMSANFDYFSKTIWIQRLQITICMARFDLKFSKKNNPSYTTDPWLIKWSITAKNGPFFSLNTQWKAMWKSILQRKKGESLELTWLWQSKIPLFKNALLSLSMKIHFQ